VALTKRQLAQAGVIWERGAVIRYRRDEDGWVATGQHGDVEADGSGRTLTATRASVLAVLARKINEQWWAAHPELDHPRASIVLPGYITVVDDVDLPAEAAQLVAAALAARDAARASAAEAADALRRAALALDEAGLSLRDAGHVLELSHARVAQVLEQARPSPGGEP